MLILVLINLEFKKNYILPISNYSYRGHVTNPLSSAKNELPWNIRSVTYTSYPNIENVDDSLILFHSNDQLVVAGSPKPRLQVCKLEGPQDAQFACGVPPPPLLPWYVICSSPFSGPFAVPDAVISHTPSPN